MPHPTTYQQALDKLKDSKVYPRKVMEKGECIGLEVYCIGILMDDMVGKLKKVLPDFNIQKIPNEEYISIKTKTK